MVIINKLCYHKIVFNAHLVCAVNNTHTNLNFYYLSLKETTQSKFA